MSKNELNLIIGNDTLGKEVSDQKIFDKLPTKFKERQISQKKAEYEQQTFTNEVFKV